MARTRFKAKGRQQTGCFLRVPSAVLDSPKFRSLSTKAKALILDIGARYNGFNNGDLAAPWSWMKSRGWRSKGTLQAALLELRQFGMIELTRQGGMDGPSLYAFTWLAIDQCRARLDVAPTSVPSGKWKGDVIADAQNKMPPREVGQTDPVTGAV